MSITIIECNKSSITLTNFIKKNDDIFIEHESEMALISADWINEAAKTIRVLLMESKQVYPITLLLPGFCLLTKVASVPRVTPSKQSKIIQTHINTLLGTGEDIFLSFDIISSTHFELNIVYCLIQTSWIQSFCAAIDLIGTKIISIEPPAIHYYNAYKKHFPDNYKNTLLAVIDSTSLYSIFFDTDCLTIHQTSKKNHKISEEIERIIDLYHTKYPQYPLQKIVIAGTHFNDSHSLKTLRKVSQLPVSTFNPLNPYSIGSLGAAYKKLFGMGLSINLIPISTQKHWAFKKLKKIILISAVCIIASLFIITKSIIIKNDYYENEIKSLKYKISPIQEIASVINQNEKIITHYNEGLNSLNSYILSNKSWSYFFNALQTIFISMPNVQIHSLKIVKQEPQKKNKKTNELHKKTNLMDITGVLFINTDLSMQHAVDEIRTLISEIMKIEFILEAKNLHFDTNSLPIIPFSLSLVLVQKDF